MAAPFFFNSFIIEVLYLGDNSMTLTLTREGAEESEIVTCVALALSALLLLGLEGTATL